MSSLSDFDTARSLGDSDGLTRRSVMLSAILVIGLLIFVGLLMGGVYWVFHERGEAYTGSPPPPPSPSPRPSTVPPQNTTNPAQLCPYLPTGSQLDARGWEEYPIPDAIVLDMKANGTWHEGCPVPIDQLALLHLPYWHCETRSVQNGLMIAHLNVTEHLITVFNELLVSGFPLARMELMATYGGDDDAAMANNNTSCFNCRAITNKPGQWSLHSYGIAVDVNTLTNPYVNGDQILPPEGAPYANRSVVVGE